MIARLLHLALLVILASTLAMLPACGRADAPKEQPPIVQRKESGPLAVIATLAPPTITTAQRATLTIDASALPGWQLSPVDLNTALPEGLSLTDSKPLSTAGDAARPVRLVISHELEPFLDGSYELKPLTVTATRPTATTDTPDALPETSSVTLDPFTITVTSVLSEGESELASVKSVVDPVEPSRWWLWTLMGVALLAAIAGATWWYLAARRRRLWLLAQPVPFAAHELALRRLDRLERRGLLRRAEHASYYEEASLILRRYIEDRFALRAPERTTEEFLQECRAGLVLSDDEVRVLSRFLGHCDMVKFAAMVPSESEARAGGDTVREFIRATQRADKTIDVRRGSEEWDLLHDHAHAEQPAPDLAEARA